jgi:hypothetical protein
MLPAMGRNLDDAKKTVPEGPVFCINPISTD